jgi:hypothetical protein
VQPLEDGAEDRVQVTHVAGRQVLELAGRAVVGLIDFFMS